MGFYSFKCCKSDISIPSTHAGMRREASTIVLLTITGEKFVGAFDGYGTLFSSDFKTNSYLKTQAWQEAQRLAKESGKSQYDHYEDTFRIVRLDFYNGEKFEDLPKNKNCEFQGYFYSKYMKSKINKSIDVQSKRIRV